VAAQLSLHERHPAIEAQELIDTSCALRCVASYGTDTLHLNPKTKRIHIYSRARGELSAPSNDADSSM